MASGRAGEATDGWVPTDEHITTVSCPECAFTFDAVHGDEGGGWSCPVCAEVRLRWALRRACHDSFSDGDGAYDRYIEDATAALSGVAASRDSTSSLDRAIGPDLLAKEPS